MKKITIFALAFVLLFAAAAPQTHAQVYYTQPFNSKEQQIAYLQAVLAQLIAQHNLGYSQQHQGTYGYNYNYNYNTPYQYVTPPRGQVYGASYSSVDVETRYLTYSDGEAELHGYVDLNSADYAYVWFEYGDDRNFDDRSSKLRKTRDGSFNVEVDDFEEDEYFYYRAVAEDPRGRIAVGEARAFFVGEYDTRNSRDDDEPDVETDDADDVRDDEAELRGEVDMNDFRNGLVFFVYGEDEDQVEDVEDENEYRDIDEDGDDLQKVIVDSDLDGDEGYRETVTGLDDNTDHYFRICVEYEDEDDDETLACGSVEHFETD